MVVYVVREAGMISDAELSLPTSKTKAQLCW